MLKKYYFNGMIFGTFQRKNDEILKLKFIILLEMVEIWICIIVIAKLLILLFFVAVLI